MGDRIDLHGRREFTLLSDEPIASTGDPLDFDAVAAELARTILRSRGATPLTLGIEGGWGTGKSSLMRKIETNLRTRPDLPGNPTVVTTVWFNAWAAEGASALEGLIKTVLHELDPIVVRRALRKRGLVRGARILGLLFTDLLRLDRLADVVWQRTSVDAQARNELRGVMHEAMRRWRERAGHGPQSRLLAVFVDDLDRASPTQVFEIFEAMKLYLDAPGFVFVVGYDQAVVSEAVLEEKKYSRTVTGREYLEKIMQVGYGIPPPDDDQAGRLLDHYMNDSGTTALFTDAARSLVIDRNQRNPRRIKRFLNTFVLLYGLEPEWQDLGPERLVDVLLLEMHFPEFVALFRIGPDADPVNELLTYRDDRRRVLDLPRAERDEALEDLHRNLPEQFPTWVTNTELVALVEPLRQTPEWDHVRRKLQRRRPVTVALPAEPLPASPTVEPQPSSNQSLRSSVLVLDDHAALDWRLSLREMLPSDRWRVTEASNADDARRQLKTRMFDALVICVERGDDPEQGFADLAELRDLHAGQAVLFASRLTPERRLRAQALRAEITSDAAEVVRLTETLPPLDVQAGGQAADTEAVAPREGRRLSRLHTAVDHARHLAASDPTTRPELAQSLDALSSALWSAGRRKEALEAGQETVTIYRTLVEEEHRRPGSDGAQLEVYLQQLARSVTTVNDYLVAMGRPRLQSQAVP